MLGHSHALSGLMVGAATLPFVPAHTPTGQAAWVAAVGGFAMLPDLDTGGITTKTFIPRLHGSTVARMWGPITCLLASGISKVARGHRNGTHDPIVGPVVFTVIAALASLWFPSRLVLLAMAIGLALEGLSFAIPGKIEETWVTNLLISFGASWWILTHGSGAPAWLPIAVGLGCLVHIAGDWPTYGGIPLPFTWLDGKAARHSLGLFKTGAWIEHVLAFGFLVAAGYLVWMHTGIAGTELVRTVSQSIR